MIFQSIPFLFLFLPIFLLGYLACPRKYKMYVLVLGSLFFYAWGDPVYVLLLIVSVIYCYIVARKMSQEQTLRRRRNILIQAIFIHVFALIYMKYYGFILDTIRTVFHTSWTYKTMSMPLGISFYTFMMLSYLLDVYWGKVKASDKFISFAAYATFFPKLVMGPIERYKTMIQDIENPSCNAIVFGEGVERFLRGLAKKVILADALGLIWAQVGQIDIQQLTTMTAWIGALAYTLQIYFDFSGYSDMAIGLAKMMGIKMSENFQFPYLSTSITMFWRRWHISLSSWFRDYIYIPLGGNRVSSLKHIRNIMVVWLLTGLWHGANWTFIVWGLYFGILLLIEKYTYQSILSKLPKPITWFLTFGLVMISWMIFAAPDLSSAIAYIKTMFGLQGSGLLNNQTWWILMNQGILLLCSILCVLPIGDKIAKRLKNTRGGAIALNIIYMGIFALSIAYMLSGTFQTFLYTQF